MAMIQEFDSQREKEKYFRSLSPEQKINAFTEMIWESEHIVFLGGAGVSTESGIPDFRSKDGLHQKAGSKKVSEIHGSALRSYCVSCRTDYGEDFIFVNTEEVPHCPGCGKMVRPDVTLYGEFLPQRAYEEAIALIRYADLLIIGGTSLEVGSAAQLAHMYHGKYMVIINKGKTKMEGKADLVFHDSIGKVMNSLDW